MQPSYRTCPTCGSMQPQTGQVCTQCGRPLPQGAQPGQPMNTPPQGYSMPGAQAARPSQQPTQPAPPVPQPAQPVQQSAQRQAPVGYGAPPSGGTVPPGYGQPPVAQQAARGYGQPQAAPPLASAPAYGGAPPQAGQQQQRPPQPPMPPQGAPMRPAPPPKKKSKAPLIIILCAVAVVLIGGGLAAFLLLGNGGTAQPDTAQADYDALVANICAQSTPANVAAYADDLADFKADHPELVERDLQNLVDTCVEYADGDPDNEYRYTTAIRTLDRLAEADNQDIAACAGTILGVVQKEYDEYISYYTDPTPPEPDPTSSSSSSSSAPPSSSTRPLEDPFADPPYNPGEMDFAELEWIDGDLWYSFTFTNTSDKTMMFAEALVFCYDKNGNPVYDEYGDNWDWGWTYNAVIRPGESYELVDYLYYLTGEQVEYIFPVITFVQFTDESEWGIDSETDDYDALYDYYDELNDEVNQLVKELLG